MTPERWEQIDKLLGQAIEHEPGERSAFLDEACHGDMALRREVESLLSAHKKAEDFIEVGPLKTGEATSRTPPRSLSGRKVGHYQILSELGRGGMGKVYQARDTVLDRTVALKVLPPELADDAERKRRFLQEARAASALNHPNIVTIYDILSEDGVDFIVMEYVQGKTLGESIPRRGLKLNEVLKYAIQIADALAKAHAVGIIHRDLKPGNLLVTEPGALKVVDFGLAKFARKTGIGPGSSLQAQQTDSVLGTEEGTVLGTVPYMSPEQAEGKAVDARSDIFSFGAVLYEMVTGRRAFQGNSPLAVLTAILREEPKPASQVIRGIPPELDRIIERCLRKDPERRFQSAADLKVVLQDIKEELDSGSLLTEVAAPSGKPAQASQLKWTAFGAALILLAVAGWLWLGRSSVPKPKATLIPVPLTAYPGWESAPSFSPDGSQVTFQWSKTSRFQDDDIYIKQIGVEGNPFQLTDHPGSDQTPAWSPDGRSIAFARMLPPDWKRMSYIVMPQRGGSERTVAEFDTPGGAIDPNLEFYKPVKWCTWTADSKSLVVVGKRAPSASFALFLVSLETREQRRLTDPPPGSADFSPAVSPNGRSLAFSRGNDYNRADLYLLSLSEEMRPQGEPERLEFDTRLNLFPAWTADGREIVFVSAHTTADMSLWKLGASNSAQRQRLPFAAPWNPVVSHQGNRLAYATWYVDTNIWRVEVPASGGKPGEAVKVFSSTSVESEPAFSPDGRQIAFKSGRSGAWEIWVADSDGSNPEKLTSFEGPVTTRPRWSPDGQRITFYSDAAGNRDVYVMRKDGSELKRLTMDPSSDTNPNWSADGKWIYFSSRRSGQQAIWKVPVEGGEALLVPAIGGGAAMESPDGKFLYYDKGGPENYGIWRVPTSGGVETQIIDSLHREGGGGVAVNEGIYFISKPDEKGVSYIRFKDVVTGSLRTIAPIEHQVWWGFAVSPDRRSFLYSQADNYGSDLMLVENF
jgi:serine/threonine protein kinase